MGPQVSAAFPKHITLLQFFRVIGVHNKSFLNTFYQLTDGTPKKNCLACVRICSVCDAIYAEVLIQSKKQLANIKRTLK